MNERRVPSIDIRFGAEEESAVLRVLRSGHVVQGQEVAAFEAEFAGLVDARPCVAVNSGTSALHLALLAAGIGPGDEVIVPSFTFAATANSVAITGAAPVFADIDPVTFCLEPASVEAALSPRTAALVPVHLYGQPAHAIALSELASRHGLLFVEDACQAHGALAGDRPVGAIGDYAAFSFYATKNMTAGEGGMVVCADDASARKVRLLRNQGMEERYRNEVIGLNNRMTDLAAAIGRVQLGRLPDWNRARQAIAARYDRELVGVTTPAVAPDVIHVYHQYTIRVALRDELQRSLRGHGIGAEAYYPVPVHQLPAYAASRELPATESAAREVLSLPVRPSLSEADLEYVVARVNEWVESAYG